MIQEAVKFAERAHEGAVRKGSRIPYITHPLEAAVIAASITSDPEVIAAAVLHDVLEDTDVTEEELRARFGGRVTGLVKAESEDKSRSWKERKAATLEHLKTASRDAKIIVLADKLSNLRCTARDYFLMGDLVWERFNEKRKELHAWYYEGVAAELGELSFCPEYTEYLRLCRLVFHPEEGFIEL